MRSLVPEDLEERLNEAQIRLQSRGVPVLILFEGESGRVISRVVNEVSRALEPRCVCYRHYDPAERAGMCQTAFYLEGTPAKGEIALYDRSWYSQAVAAYDGGGSLEEAAEGVRCFERYLADNGTLLVKIRLDATAETMCQHADEYRPTTPLNGTYLSVDRIDRVKYEAVMPRLSGLTDTKACPWDAVEVGGVKDTVREACRRIAARMERASERGLPKTGTASERRRYPNPREGLDQGGGCKGYDGRMEELSDELERLQILLALSGRSLICAFEGWDAAGKGGCIKHLGHGLNPRGYRVARIGAPGSADLAHTYLWRFARHLPGPGHAAIFDRSWYGRMMVEPIEGLCTEDEYRRSADEINGFEKALADEGAIILKFWLDIDPDEQLRRFEDRKSDPLKSWKLTDEDWRNRAKRDVYERYVDDMIAATNTPWAPWSAVAANSKKAAQLTVLSEVVGALRRELVDKGRPRRFDPGVWHLRLYVKSRIADTTI